MNPRIAAATLALFGSVALAIPAAAQPLTPSDTEALRTEIESLRARLDALEKRLAGDSSAAAGAAAEAGSDIGSTSQAASPPAATAASGNDTPAVIKWKGAAQIVEDDRSFKAKGRIQADAGYVSQPDGSTDKGLGFVNEMRRIRLGAEGSIGSGVGYKLELELSDNSVDLVDTYISYRTGGLQLRLGNQNPPWSLDELTGDTAGNVMERAAFTDAFNFERRLGFVAQYETGDLLTQAGVFTDDVSALANDSDGPSGGDENNSYSLHGRLVYAPKIGKTQLHAGASAHWRRLGRITEDGVRYRQRPYLHASNSRLIGTRSLLVEREFGYGAELAAVRGRWQTAGEVFVQKAIRGGLPDLTFWGGYAELSYFLTNDTRTYKDGQFGSVAPSKPIGEGGPGSIQLTLRYDYLDLNDRTVIGGTQDGYIAAIIWSPLSNLRFNLNYANLSYEDAVALPSGDRSYDVQVLGTRFEFDF
ncbi:OprO/OprP family phosphate-selective porin [Novosphingobium sp. M1R2S20]|uniref:OprO/OprP family phosphate-selective porin n=1 Tax=Novosphingobium rhizovicinum TaxID=3228928 RepID=A0ABV3RDF7_9SPHN